MGMIMWEKNCDLHFRFIFLYIILTRFTPNSFLVVHNT
jgi:hypothetical protein